ncbi:MAG TPA: LysR family transcriptional regulator [Hyphomicrobiaceae bacterium]|nr:LysR family transcriptional regulator [Hyphomicrobiaceae bacterium]
MKQPRPDTAAIETVVAIARHGSPAAAAEALGRNVTTTYRHINALETELGVKLFDRHHGGWKLRPEGRALADAGAELERLLDRALDQARAQARFARGKLRIAVSDDFATAYLATRLKGFIDRFPEIQPDLIVGNTFADLVAGDADVAIRPHRYPGDDLVGQRVAMMNHAFYAAAAYVKSYGKPASTCDLKDHRLIGFGESLSGFTAAEWLTATVGHTVPCAGFGSTMSMTNATASGLGVGLLPCYIADADKSLIPVLPIEGGLGIDIWLVTPEQRKNEPNTRAFFRHFGAVLRADAAMFIGAPYRYK